MDFFFFLDFVSTVFFLLLVFGALLFSFSFCSLCFRLCALFFVFLFWLPAGLAVVAPAALFSGGCGGFRRGSSGLCGHGSAGWWWWWCVVAVSGGGVLCLRGGGVLCLGGSDVLCLGGRGVVKLWWQLWWWWCVVIRCCWFRWGLFEGVLAVVVVVVG
ncbi:hypothetical protein QL285_086391 [Trifolium repens]|nr:hypothetical protein QL285_086391 [Trifolium repens]